MATELSTNLRLQLDLIEPSESWFGLLRYPCAAELRDGTVLNCVYFVDLATFERTQPGKQPEEAYGPRYVSPDRVASIRESPLRLPARFANEIYRAGEAGMGYFDFCLVFSFWCRRDYVVGLVDFLEYPRWYGPADVKAVILYRNKRKPRRQPETWWCVFAR